MFIKHGDGKILDIVNNNDVDLEKDASDKLLKLKNQFAKQLKNNLAKKEDKEQS